MVYHIWLSVLSTSFKERCIRYAYLGYVVVYVWITVHSTSSRSNELDAPPSATLCLFLVLIISTTGPLDPYVEWVGGYIDLKYHILQQQGWVTFLFRDLHTFDKVRKKIKQGLLINWFITKMWLTCDTERRCGAGARRERRPALHGTDLLS